MLTETPSALLHRHLDVVLERLPGILDGERDSVHQARIATRRAREVLPLLDKEFASDAGGTIREVGRHLGRVRELDVMARTLRTLSDRVPAAAAVAYTARRALLERLLHDQRAMIKAIERLNLTALRRGNQPRYPRVAALADGAVALLHHPAWVTVLWDRLAARGGEVRDAVGRTSAVYFPRRAHEARVAVKKLRYALEAAIDLGIWRPERALKELRRVQNALGDVHDAEVLKQTLDDIVPGHAGSAELQSIKAALDDDIARHHAAYVHRRERVLTIADFCAYAAARSVTWRRRRNSLAAATACAVPMLFLGRSRR